MPITYADTPAAVEEERRLLYVGITRARKHLWLSWALARNPGGQARRKPSRFLAGLRPESVTDRAAAAVGRQVRTRNGARRQRSASSASARWPARASATAATAATARCPTTRSCSSRCALAQGAGRGPERARPSWCSPTRPSRRSPRSSRPTATGSSRSTGSAPPSSRSTPRTCSPSSADRWKRAVSPGSSRTVLNFFRNSPINHLRADRARAYRASHPTTGHPGPGTSEGGAT